MNNTNPFERGFPGEIESLFNSLLGSRQYPKQKSFRRPISEVMEGEKEFIATIELPGVNKEEIKATVTDKGIEIKVEKKNNSIGFYKYVSLPNYADKENAQATYKNGVLELKIPKIEKKSRQLIIN